MPDFTVIPPFKVSDDIWLPLDPEIASEILEDLASSLMVTAINTLFPGVPVDLNLDGTIDVAGVTFSLEFDLCPKICPPGSVKSLDGKTCGCPEGFQRNEAGNCVCIPGWWATPVFNDRPLSEGVVVRQPPRVFMFGPTRPPVTPGFLDHVDMFRQQAGEILRAKYAELNFPVTQLSTLDPNNYLPFWPSGLPDTDRWRIDGIIYGIEARLCPPQKTVVPAYMITNKVKVVGGFVYREQTVECGDFTIDFDDVIETIEYADTDFSTTYGYGTFYTSTRNKSEVSKDVTYTHYKTWDGRSVPFVYRSHTREGSSNNPDVPSESVNLSIAISVNWAFVPQNSGTFTVLWDQPDDYQSQTRTFNFGACPVATPFVNPIVNEILCVDNTGVEHPKDDSEFNFYACRVSNTVTCAARFLANGLAQLAVENRQDIEDWIAAGSPPASGSPLGSGIPVITPADIARVTALAAIEAVINCPPNIDNGSYPPLYIDPLIPTLPPT